MNPIATPAPSVAVDVAVILTAIIVPEPEAGGYSASAPPCFWAAGKKPPLVGGVF